MAPHRIWHRTSYVVLFCLKELKILLNRSFVQLKGEKLKRRTRLAKVGRTSWIRNVNTSKLGSRCLSGGGVG